MYKYYTPEIEEFHIGFEFILEEEFLDENGSAYFEETKKIFDINTPITFNRCIRVMGYPLSYLSVKYLDFKDIESLGFGISMGSKEYEIFSNKSSTIFIKFIRGSQLITITKSSSRDKDLNMPIIDGVIFEGRIKNKSELKVLLKQLGIK